MRGSSVFHHRSLLRPIFQVVMLSVIFIGTCFARPKKDVIQLDNGDRITCEIIKLQKGYLYVKLPYADGTVSIDWSKVARIESPQGFVVTDKTAKRYNGTLESLVKQDTPTELTVKITGPATQKTLTSSEIVEIERADNSLWQNLHGSADVGFNYTRQQSRSQVNVNSTVAYARPRWSVDTDFQSNFSGGGNGSSTRTDLQFTGLRQLRTSRDFVLGLAEFLHSSEQELDLRTTTGVALGHVFRNTNNSYINAFGGAVWNRENYADGATVDGTPNSVEAVVGTLVNLFHFKTTNFLLNAKVYPSLSELGRVRFDMNTSLRLRIAKDLYWSVGYNLNFDSRPPTNLQKADFGTNSSLGWTF
jgi:putative salt-induced outer membrane protein YdiY